MNNSCNYKIQILPEFDWYHHQVRNLRAHSVIGNHERGQRVSVQSEPSLCVCALTSFFMTYKPCPVTTVTIHYLEKSYAGIDAEIIYLGKVCSQNINFLYKAQLQLSGSTLLMLVNNFII